MPVPALKTTEYIAKLNDALNHGKRLGDMDRYGINKLIDAILNKDPVNALILRAALAHYDRNFNGAINDLKSATSLAPNSLEAHSNYATLLARTGKTGLASVEIRKSISLCIETRNFMPLENLIISAVNIGDIDAAEEIVHIAFEKKIPSRIIADAALLLSLNDSSDENVVERLETMLTSNGLNVSCAKIEEDEWNAMKRLADELSQYVD